MGTKSGKKRKVEELKEEISKLREQNTTLHEMLDEKLTESTVLRSKLEVAREALERIAKHDCHGVVVDLIPRSIANQALASLSGKE